MKTILSLLIVSVCLLSCDTLCDCDNDDNSLLDCNNTYAGFWKASCNCAPISANNYTLTINESDDCLMTTFYNFLGDGEVINVEFKTQSVVIPTQEFDRDDDIFGTGFLNNDTLKITFTLKDRTFGWEDICELIAVKE